MKRATAVAILASLATATALALLAPWPVAVALALASIVTMRAGRGAFLLFAGTAVAINAAVLAYVGGGWAMGALGGARLAAAAGANLAILSWVRPALLLDALRLAPRVTGLLGAVLLSAQDVARDFARLRDARRLDGEWPRGAISRARAAAALLPHLLLAANRRALVRRDALRLAGHAMPEWFVPLVAVAGLAAAGRLALLALPNVALTYVVVFLGGLLFGPFVAAGGAALAMLLTDFALTGLYPAAFVNVPAMMLVGIAGGLLRGFDFVGGSRTDRIAGAAFAAFFGLALTLLFSVATDALTWALLYRNEPAALGPLVLAGLAFNAIPAVLNALVFGASVQPTVRAFAAATRMRTPQPAPRAQARPSPEPDAAPTGAAGPRP